MRPGTLRRSAIAVAAMHRRGNMAPKTNPAASGRSMKACARQATADRGEQDKADGK